MTNHYSFGTMKNISLTFYYPEENYWNFKSMLTQLYIILKKKKKARVKNNSKRSKFFQKNIKTSLSSHLN